MLQIATCVINFVHSNWRENNRLVTKQLNYGVPLICVAQHFWNDPMSVESLTIGSISEWGTSCVIPTIEWKVIFFACYSETIDIASLLPVVKIAIVPFPVPPMNISAWYRFHFDVLGLGKLVGFEIEFGVFLFKLSVCNFWYRIAEDLRQRSTRNG